MLKSHKKGTSSGCTHNSLFWPIDSILSLQSYSPVTIKIYFATCTAFPSQEFYGLQARQQSCSLVHSSWLQMSKYKQHPLRDFSLNKCFTTTVQSKFHWCYFATKSVIHLWVVLWSVFWVPERKYKLGTSYPWKHCLCAAALQFREHLSLRTGPIFLWFIQWCCWAHDKITLLLNTTS